MNAGLLLRALRIFRRSVCDLTWRDAVAVAVAEMTAERQAERDEESEPWFKPVAHNPFDEL